MEKVGKFLAIGKSRREEGATASEYALMISGIALVLVAATYFLGERLADAIETLKVALF